MGSPGDVRSGNFARDAGFEKTEVGSPDDDGVDHIVIDDESNETEMGSPGNVGVKTVVKNDGWRKMEMESLGDVRVGKDAMNFYIVTENDAAVLGFSVSRGRGPRHYFPMYFSPGAEIPAVVLEVYVSKSGREMWVASSWPNHKILAYRKIGKNYAQVDLGWIKFFKEPLPAEMSGGPAPYPELNMKKVVKVATFMYRAPAPRRTSWL
jgi:hypothetical protein